MPSSLERLSFYVVAPEKQVNAGVFEDLVTKQSIREKVRVRVSQYNGAKSAWFEDAFEPTLERVDLAIITWESILDHMVENGSDLGLTKFYERCLDFNPL